MPKHLIQNWGLLPYEQAFEKQEAIFKQIIADKRAEKEEKTPNHLISCSHPHVYTLGKSGKKEHVLLSEKALKEKAIAFFPTTRGGDITYHGPGQLVVYPIFDLEDYFRDIHRYMRTLEEAVILTLADFGIKAGRVKGLTGVWIEVENPGKARKICAMGVKCSRWVSMHGLALNVSPDMNFFNYIVPCGIQDKAVTSMEMELGHQPDFELVRLKLLAHIARQFESTPINV